MANYSTVARVRTEAGFDGNANVTDAYIQAYLDQATNIVNGKVFFRYAPSTFTANFSGSQAEATLQRCEELLAAGYLLAKEYGAENVGEKSGKEKIKMAMDLLCMIADGDMLLLDSNGAIYAQQASNPSVDGPVLNMPAYDQDAPTVAGAEPSDRKFSVDDTF
jgi:hypothetical protein